MFYLSLSDELVGASTLVGLKVSSELVESGLESSLVASNLGKLVIIGVFTRRECAESRSCDSHEKQSCDEFFLHFSLIKILSMFAIVLLS